MATPKRILIAEDDHDLLSVLRDRMESFGYRVTTATNGQQALEAIISSHYSLAIMDVIMPEMDGIEVLRLIRGLHLTIPVIMISANEGKAIAASAEGAQAYIVKPIDQGKLKVQLNRLLRVK